MAEEHVQVSGAIWLDENNLVRIDPGAHEQFRRGFLRDAFQE